ncbi:MAG: Rieske 2Fe-2S domain-containing protein, partial [Candidatus Eremiobacteraeota bacterium]|nr:Rieske 2Fe-2S domain-containing protein [Candidatus Eremiobacteraeota bacterium]
MRRFWHPVALSSDVRPGRVRAARALGEAFVLYRSASGNAHALEAGCAHRCTTLAVGTVEGENLRCLYHGWMYDETGQCIEQPAEPKPFAEKIKIRSFPAREYLGLIFCFFGEDEAPPLPRYAALERQGVVSASGYVRNCNFFQNIDNHCDPVHVNFTHRLSLHPAMTSAGVSGETPEVRAEETEYGMALHTRYPDGRTSTNRVIMPNAVEFALPPNLPGEEDWSHSVAWRVPIDDEHHFSCRAEFRQLNDDGKAALEGQIERRRGEDASGAQSRRRTMLAQILEGDATLADFAGIIDSEDLVYLEDSLSQEGQGRIVDRSREHL